MSLIRLSAASQLPFAADPDDHCETSPAAYAHVAPVLLELARRMGKPARDLAIYDPYYCAGSVRRHLGRLGFAHVINRNEDFYSAMASGARSEFAITQRSASIGASGGPAINNCV